MESRVSPTQDGPDSAQAGPRLGTDRLARGICWRCRADLSRVDPANPWLCLDCYAGKPETTKRRRPKRENA